MSSPIKSLSGLSKIAIELHAATSAIAKSLATAVSTFKQPTADPIAFLSGVSNLSNIEKWERTTLINSSFPFTPSQIQEAINTFQQLKENPTAYLGLLTDAAGTGFSGALQEIRDYSVGAAASILQDKVGREVVDSFKQIASDPKAFANSLAEAAKGNITGILQQIKDASINTVQDKLGGVLGQVSAITDTVLGKEAELRGLVVRAEQVIPAEALSAIGLPSVPSITKLYDSIIQPIANLAPEGLLNIAKGGIDTPLRGLIDQGTAALVSSPLINPSNLIDRVVSSELPLVL